MKKPFVAIAASSLALAPAIANAQEPLRMTQPVPEEQQSWFSRTTPAPSRALEVDLSTGFTQGFGTLTPGVEVPRVATGGVGAELGLGYRVTPHWGIGVAGQYSELNAERAAAVHGFTGTVGFRYHFSPYTNLDPWIEVGAGYRGLWETLPLNQLPIDHHALQLGRVRVGADFRATENVSLGPFIGADANVVLVQNGRFIDDPSVSTFVTAGIVGRFDVGGYRTTPATTVTPFPSETLAVTGRR